MVVQKYIIVNDSPVLFSSDILHSDVVCGNKEVQSAGFFVLHISKVDRSIKVICFGASSSLLISSRPEIDQEIISNYLGILQ